MICGAGFEAVSPSLARLRLEPVMLSFSCYTSVIALGAHQHKRQKGTWRPPHMDRPAK